MTAASLYSSQLLSEFTAGEYQEYLLAGGRPLRERVARSLALADLRPGLRVVDVGAGRGEAALHCARRGCRVTALDFSPGALGLARQTASLAITEGGATFAPSLAAASAASLPIEARSADRVLLLDVIEHLEPAIAEAALHEIERILAPAGRVVIHTLPNRWALAVGYRGASALVPGLPSNPRSEYEKQVHVNEQSPWSLKRSLLAAGFESRVWVEEWSLHYAQRRGNRPYPDQLRRQGYPALRNRHLRRLVRALVSTPLRWLISNDIFAVAWRTGETEPPMRGKFAPLDSVGGPVPSTIKRSGRKPR